MSARPRKAPRPASDAVAPVPPVRPALARDPWLLAIVIALVLLIARAWGAPLGEPVADDFDHLHHVLFSGSWSWFDGGGSASFWRPLAYQGWYGLWHDVILSHPGVLATLHVLLLGLVAVLVYDLARDRLNGPAAAVAATFPLGLEATRALVTVPVHIVDLGLVVASGLAWWAAARGRFALALVALLAGLSCKETAIVTALLLPWLARTDDRHHRVRWIVGAWSLALAWAIAYVLVRRGMALALPHGLEAGLGPAMLGEGARYAWAFAGTLRACVSLPMTPVAWEGALVGAGVLLVGLAGVRFATDAAARARFAGVRGLVLVGLAWTILATLTLLPVHPVWSPERIVYTSLGAGVALAALLGAAHPGLLVILVALRVTTFVLAPVAPTAITRLAPERGAFVDFERLARLQRLAREVRTALAREYPVLPHGARIAWVHPPHGTDYALGDRALQVWRRDSTLHWVRWESLDEAGAHALAGALEFREDATPPIRRVAPGAIEELFAAARLQRAGRTAEALTRLARADSLQTDREALHIRARIVGYEAWLLGQSDRLPEAEARAHEALLLSDQEAEAHLTLAAVLQTRGEWDASLAHLDSVLTWYPGFRKALDLQAFVRDRRAAVAAGARP